MANLNTIINCLLIKVDWFKERNYIELGEKKIE